LLEIFDCKPYFWKQFFTHSSNIRHRTQLIKAISLKFFVEKVENCKNTFLAKFKKKRLLINEH